MIHTIDKGELTMKKRIALLLLTGACLMNTVPCFASQSVKVSYVGSQGTEYAALPSSETLQKDVGFKPKAPAALTGGYLFDSGRITESTVTKGMLPHQPGLVRQHPLFLIIYCP